MRTSGLVLFICSGLLLSGGVILSVATSWSIVRMSYYFWTTDLGVELGSGVVFVAGAVLCLPACWLASLLPYHARSMTLLGTLMFLSTTAMLTLSVGMSAMMGLSRGLREPATLNASMLRAMAYEPLDPAVRSAFSAMQIENRCCGVQSPDDWYQHRRSLPPSCCSRMWNSANKSHNRGPEQCNVALHVSGCLRPALIELRYFVSSVTTLAGALILVIAVTLFAAAYITVTSVVELGDSRALKTQQVRVACLHPQLFASVPGMHVSMAAPANAPTH